MSDTRAPTRPDAVLDPADPRWARLHRLIDTHSLLRGDFTLSSGRKSNYLFQTRQTTMLPEGAHLIADIVVDYMKAQSIAGVGGLAVGAVPMVAAIAAVSFAKGAPVEAFFVRKEAKGHGARERIDGYVPKGGEALIVDDVATTGGSILEAIAGMKEEHPQARATRALVVIDREEGAAEKLAEQGITLVSIFKRGDFTI
ncbi:orotate phosphoribosyltransferase [Methylosinus sp. H3A]|uniref:orotate phosphoribosyltransferase n=1 Tax=Methylosinus sp. H3A TaxID=2785786 RepID=UPI0018C2FD46|nr:orotate phosphoribosyltransferase [Methylosinus sp. H3A]MBG0810159.1 orotate phosphoribosyltransferase [Methylosinus sp. H3A]